MCTRKKWVHMEGLFILQSPVVALDIHKQIHLPSHCRSLSVKHSVWAFLNEVLKFYTHDQYLVVGNARLRWLV